MKIHRSAKICRHTKGGYLAQQLIHKTKSGYTDPGHYIHNVHAFMISKIYERVHLPVYSTCLVMVIMTR